VRKARTSPPRPASTIVEQTFRRTGVSVMGKRMFDLGERMWPEEAPFHTPMLVMTSGVAAGDSRAVRRA
jgi:hypothetical protein